MSLFFEKLKSQWFKSRYVIIQLSIFISLVAIDQISKQFALHSFNEPGGAFLTFSFIPPVKNFDLVLNLKLGSGSFLAPTYFTAILCLFLFYYVISLIFIPKAFFYLQTGISILFAGFLSNIVNKIFNGYVLDFIKWSPSKDFDLYFNLADIFQTLAWGLIIAQFVFLKKTFPEDRRKQLIVMRSYQLQFIGYSALAFFILSAFFLLINYQFIGFIQVTNFANIRQISFSFLTYSFFFLFLICIFIGIFFYYLSNKIYGPVYAFERYIKALLKGENPEDLKLRKHDQLKQLEGLAKNIKKHIKD